VLGDPRFRKETEERSRAFVGPDGAEPAADSVERLIAARV
jgi:hypothetical protein